MAHALPALILSFGAALGFPMPETDPQPRALRADLDHEPVLQVLIARAPTVTIELARASVLTLGDASTTLGKGDLVLEADADGWRVAGGAQTLRRQAVLRSEGEAVFRVDATPAFGEVRSLTLRGDLLLSAEGGFVLVVERLPMEDYVASVVGAEMNVKWPREALAAQAIVARSYAAARWLERREEAWHLHWHFGVDMAYHGWTKSQATLAEAIASTRGVVLIYHDLPVLALFHASSGGRTESFERIKPGVLGPDGVTPIAAAMPVVDDPAALPGARGLSLLATHGRWKADLPLEEVTRALSTWSKARAGRPRIGAVEGVSIQKRHADSGRVDTVEVRHRLDGKERRETMLATEFRMAVSPVRIRSVWWDRCVIASRGAGYLVLEGRGFGHGCGLSQVSAWYLAQQGASAREIVARFYAGARIEKRY